jgi:hypothetical protein
MRLRVLAVAALAVALAVAAWRLSAPPPPSDEDLVRRLFEDAALAAEEKRVSDAVAGVSERFRGEGLDRPGVKQLVAALVFRGQWVRVSIAGVEVRVEGDRATAIVDAVLARAAGQGKALGDLLPGEATAHRFDCALEREEDGWRVVAASWRPVALEAAFAGPPAPDAPAAPPGGEPPRAR